MEKLIQLLNERDAKDWSKRKRYFVPNRICWEWCDNSECSELLIISKKFWFIKRLVENDKIDFDKLEDNIDWYYIKLDDDYMALLALLSIQDNPINLLISILK